MRTSGRPLFVAAGFATLALQPVVALAAPSPSPALSKVLVAAPSDFVEADTSAPGMFEGAFDAKAFVEKTGAPNASGVQQTLARDGFVDGYWRTWVQSNTHHVLVKIVIAFKGGDGANSWLRSAELADKSDPNNQHPIAIGGISAYYGARFFYKSNNGCDGGYWWDGRQWRDAKTDIPPQAQRTADGQFWWDGQQWLPVA